MKREVLQYYPFVKEDQVFVTGTPQFEPHFDDSLVKSRDTFFAENNFKLKKSSKKNVEFF